MLILGTIVTDIPTGLTGMLTHYQLESGGNEWYRFQPRGLSPETMEPVDGCWITEDRIKDASVMARNEVSLPTQVLGTKVEDIATGFAGVAISLIFHINGCVHIQIQPSGTVPKTGAPIKCNDFDLRRVRGKAVPTLTPEALDKSRADTPSPIEVRGPQPASVATTAYRR